MTEQTRELLREAFKAGQQHEYRSTRFPSFDKWIEIKQTELNKLDLGDVSTSLSCTGCIYGAQCNSDKVIRCEDYLA